MSNETTNEKGITRALLSGLTGVGALKLGSLALVTLSSIVVARSLGPAGYGQVAFVFAVLNLLAIPTSSAVNPLLIRHVSNYQLAADWSLLRGLLRWTGTNTTLLAVSIMVPILGWACWNLLSTPTDRAVLFCIAVPFVLFWTWAARVSGVLQGLRKVVLAQSFDWIINPVIYLVLVVILWSKGALTPITVLLSSLGALVVSVIAGTITLQKSIPEQVVGADIELERKVWLSAWRHFIVIQVVGVANIQVPVVLLGIFGTEAQTGLFRVSENIASLLAISLLVVNAVIAPYITRLHAIGNMQELERIARGTARVALAFTLPAFFIVLFAGEWLLGFLFGESYTSAFPALVILLIGQVVNVACGSVGLLLNMTGHEKISMNALAMALALNLILGAVLIPGYGAVGAAIGASVSTIVWNVLLAVRTRKLLGIGAAVFSRKKY
ncbi:MAG: polysaccharide biosynthesis C-terminal domain-containing protein [Gammaproteobacteria bacterium]|nr:polysaccharide biosynthesis C-terminal domain-containing protein [Gammaproteobacteria bacterium]